MLLMCLSDYEYALAPPMTVKVGDALEPTFLGTRGVDQSMHIMSTVWMFDLKLEG